MKILYLILVLSTGLLLGVAAACYWRVRRTMKASDAALREALEEIEKEREATKL